MPRIPVLKHSWLKDNTRIVTTSVDKTIKVVDDRVADAKGVEDDDGRAGARDQRGFPGHELLSLPHSRF